MPKHPAIIAEGTADNEFLTRLIASRQLPEFDILVVPQQEGGYRGFSKRLRGLRTPTARESHSAIILVADNDDNPAERLNEIRQQIEIANDKAVADDRYGVPDRPRQSARQSPSLPPIAILMLPWDDEPGCLESLCLRAANSKYSKQLDCVENLVRCIDVTGWEPVKVSKLRMQCFLSAACKSDPTTSLRWALSTDGGRPGDILSLDHPCFNQIAAFLESFR